MADTVQVADDGEAYYKDNYPDYQRQNSHRKLQHYRAQVSGFVVEKAKEPFRIHDIGCAFGDFLATLPASWQTYGSDQNAFAVRNSHARHARLNVGSACSEILFDEAFDVVTAFDVLEHVEDISTAARLIQQQLKPNGYFHFVVPVYDGITGPVIRKLDKDPTHIHKLSRKEWLAWCQTGFELVQWHGIFRYFVPGLNYYLHFPTKKFRKHVPAIFVTCKNKVQR